MLEGYSNIAQLYCCLLSRVSPCRMVRARKYREEHEIGSFPVKLLISCPYSFYTVASETSDIASNEDSYCKTPVTLSDINTTSLLKAEYYLCEGIPLAVCWDCRCSSKATLGTMCSAPFTAPVQPAATPDPPTQREGCALWWEVRHSLPSPGCLTKALDCPCHAGVPLESLLLPVGAVGAGLSQALTSMGSVLSGLWTLTGFT